MQVVIFAKLLTSIAYGTIIFSSAIKAIRRISLRLRAWTAQRWEIVKAIILPNLRFHIMFIALWDTARSADRLCQHYAHYGRPRQGRAGMGALAYHKAFIDGKYGYGAAISPF